MGLVFREVLGWGEVDGDVTLGAQCNKDVMVGGVGRASYPKVCGEAGLLRMEPPEGREEPMPGGAPDKGIGVVEVPGVDCEEVRVPNDLRGGDPNSSFQDVRHAVGAGLRGPPRRRSYGGRR